MSAVAYGSVKIFEDRVSIIVTGKDFKCLLGVTVALKGTGQHMAEVVFQEVDPRYIFWYYFI